MLMNQSLLTLFIHLTNEARRLSRNPIALIERPRDSLIKSCRTTRVP